MDQLDKKLQDMAINCDSKEPDERQNLTTQINELLRNTENCEKWFKEYGPFNTEILENVVKVLTTEFQESLNESTSDSELKYYAIENIAKRSLQARIHIENNDLATASEVVQEAQKLIKNCKEKKYFSEVYATGFSYVIKCLEIVLDLKKRDVPLVSLQESLDFLREHETFSAIDEVAVLALKQYFLGNVKRDLNFQDVQIEILKKMIDMDPENLEWHYCLYTLYMFKRQRSDKKYEPTSEEKDAINEAYTVSNNQFHPRIQLGFITCLAETVSCLRNAKAILYYGDKAFTNKHEAVKYIRENAEKILELDPMSVRSNINIAKLFSSILPKEHRDINFAKTCIERALRFHPGSSKANHRMGIILLRTRNFEEAIQYFEKAFNGDVRNSYAIYDLMSSYLHDVTKHGEKLQTVVNKLLADEHFKNDPDKKVEILFFLTIYHFLNKRTDAGVESLINAYKISAKVTEQIKNILQDKQRFDWNDGGLLSYEFQNILRKAQASTTDQVKKQILSEILKVLEASQNKGNRPKARGGQYGNSRSNYSGERGNKAFPNMSGNRTQRAYGSTNRQENRNWRDNSKLNTSQEN